MKKTALALLVGTSLLASSAMAVEVVNSKGFTLDVGGRLQELASIQYLPAETARQNVRLFLFNKETRLHVAAKVNTVKYYAEVAFGAEETSKPQWGSSALNTDLSLMDFYADFPFLGAQIRAGQFKPALNRESSVIEDNLMFARPSVANMAIDWGRDVGATYYGKNSGLDYAVGIFTGAGADLPERYLPEWLGIPMITAKVGINNLDSDALTPAIQPSGKVDGVKSAIFVNATYIKDSLAGHGTALGTKYSQRSLILNTLFNPNISQFGDTTYLQGGVEGAWLMPFGNGNMLVQTEANAAFTSSPTSGNASVLGAMIQATVKDGGLFDYGIRASLLMPRELSSIGTETISEITPSLVYHIDGDNASIIVDAPILLNTAVKVDSTHHGLYEITNVTNSVSGSGVFRTTTYALRIMGQFLF